MGNPTISQLLLWHVLVWTLANMIKWGKTNRGKPIVIDEENHECRLSKKNKNKSTSTSAESRIV